MSFASVTNAVAMLTRPTIPRRVHLLLLLVIICGAAVIRGVLFSGYVGLDDAEYTRFAYVLAHDRPFPTDYTGPPVFPLRVGVYVPASLIVRAFGASEWAVVLYPYVVSLATIALMYAVASSLFGWQAGVLAATLLSVFELDIDNATMLLPDLPAAFFAAVGVTLIMLAERREQVAPSFSSVQKTRSRTSYFRTGLLAGLSFGAAWLCKESVVYLVPFCLALMAITVRRMGYLGALLWGGVAAGSLTVLSLEILTHWWMTGDPLLRLNAVEHNYKQWENGFFTEGSDSGWASGTSYRDALIDRLFVSGPSKIVLDRALAYVPFVALIGAAYGWIRRDRAFLVPGLWLLSLALMFNFASSSTAAYVPITLFYRYMYLMYLPAFVLAGGFLARLLLAAPEARGLFARRHAVLLARTAGLAVLGFVLWTSALNVYYGLRSRSAWTAEARALRDVANPATPIYSDALSLRAFEFFAGYPAETAWVGFEHLVSSDPIPPGSLVLVNKRYIEWLDRNAGMWVTWPHAGKTDTSGYRMHGFYDRAPSTWSQIWANDNARLFRVNAHTP